MGCYHFTIRDSFGDGLIHGDGGFVLIVDGVTLLEDNDNPWSSLASGFYGTSYQPTVSPSDETDEGETLMEIQ